MIPGAQYVFGGFLLGAVAMQASLFVFRWARDRREAREERIRDLEKWLYGVEREQAVLKVRVADLEKVAPGMAKGEKA